MISTGPFRRGGLSPLQLLMILQLNEEPKYGYELLKELREHFKGVWEPKTGTIYPALRSLETRGLVKTDLKDEKEFYNLTEKGVALLKRMGERREGDLMFNNRYFDFIDRHMPQSMKMKILERLTDISEKTMPSTVFIEMLVHRDMDPSVKLKALGNLKRFLEDSLNLVEKAIQGLGGE